MSWKKVEDPVYVEENNVPIDYLYYFDHQLKSPLETIFDILVGKDKCKKMLTNRKLYIEAKKEEKEQILVKRKIDDKIKADEKRVKDGNGDIRLFFPIKN